jgi:transglutaminase-like putative cysteine protease
MKQMRQQVRDTLKKSREAIQTANMVVAAVSPRDKRSQIDAIFDWLSHRFRFVPDPIGVELLRNPADSIHQINRLGFAQGDCDEAAMITAVLAMANGIPARFRSLAFNGPSAPYSHVVTDLAPGDGKWYPIDITKPPGFFSPLPSRTLLVMV